MTNEAKSETAIQPYGPPTRFMLWAAATDLDLLAQAPRGDVIRHAAIGFFVCVVAVIATLGWKHETSSWGYGLLAGAVVFGLDRLLLACALPVPSPGERWQILGGRAAIAAFSALATSVPLVLGYHSGEIIGFLDDRKYLLKATSRQQADDIHGVNASAAQVEKMEKALAVIERRRHNMPAELRNALIEAEACRNAALWRADLSVSPVESCRHLTEEVGAARRRYHAALDAERAPLLVRRAENNRVYADAQRQASADVARSDEVTALRTAGETGARATALIELAGKQWFYGFSAIFIYGLIFLIEMMPLYAKTRKPSIYDCLLDQRERKAVGHAALARIRAEAEVIGAREYYASGEGRRMMMEAEAVRVRDVHERLDIASLVSTAETATAAVRQDLTQAAVLEREPASWPIRSAIARLRARAAASMKAASERFARMLGRGNGKGRGAEKASPSIH